MGASPIAPATATAVRKGRFSVVTHPDPSLICARETPAPVSSPLDATPPSPLDGKYCMNIQRFISPNNCKLLNILVFFHIILASTAADPTVFHVLHMSKQEHPEQVCNFSLLYLITETDQSDTFLPCCLK